MTLKPTYTEKKPDRNLTDVEKRAIALYYEGQNQLRAYLQAFGSVAERMSNSELERASNGFWQQPRTKSAIRNMQKFKNKKVSREELKEHKFFEPTYSLSGQKIF